MKKGIVLFLAFSLLITPLVYAQGARNASDQTITHSRTNFTNIGATGLDTVGNPGFLILTGVTNQFESYRPEWYFWVDRDNDLCQASHRTVVTYSSFPSGDWSSGMPCTKVGGQS